MLGTRVSQHKGWSKGWVIIALSVALNLAGCGNSSNSQRVYKAPKNASETGFTAKGLSPQQVDQFLEDHPEARARSLHKGQGYYEFTNATPSQLKEAFPQIRLHKNIYTQWIDVSNQNQPTNAQQASAYFKKISTSEEGLDCEVSADMPELHVDLITPYGDVPVDEAPAFFLELGYKIKLSGAKSQAHPDHPSPLHKAWMLIPPGGSEQEQVVVAGDEIEFTPDSMGQYAVLFIIQDNRNVCSMAFKMIGMTDNQPFLGNSSDMDNVEPESLEAFTHLETVDAESSWNLSQGSDVVIAIIDTGVNWNHDSLYRNIRVNENEIPDNGLDDDDNGLVDDSSGYDFAMGDNMPFDDQGHGSHVAGLAASHWFGLAKKAKILPIKALNALGSGDMASIAAAIYYAVDQGADVINMSLGAPGEPHPDLQDAMDYADEHGVIVVAAAGNGDEEGNGVNIDEEPVYPACFPNDNIVTVAAQNKDHELSSYSNYGTFSVDVAAPGGDKQDDVIVSAFMDNPKGIKYVGFSGTSMASPIVAGMAAQILGANPSLSPVQVKSILMKTGSLAVDAIGKVGSGRFVNAYEAVTASLTQTNAVETKAREKDAIDTLWFLDID